MQKYEIIVNYYLKETYTIKASMLPAKLLSKLNPPPTKHNTIYKPLWCFYFFLKLCECLCAILNKWQSDRVINIFRNKQTFLKGGPLSNLTK